MSFWLPLRSLFVLRFWVSLRMVALAQGEAAVADGTSVTVRRIAGQLVGQVDLALDEGLDLRPAWPSPGRASTGSPGARSRGDQTGEPDDPQDDPERRSRPPMCPPEEADVFFGLAEEAARLLLLRPGRRPPGRRSSSDGGRPGRQGRLLEAVDIVRPGRERRPEPAGRPRDGRPRGRRPGRRGRRRDLHHGPALLALALLAGELVVHREGLAALVAGEGDAHRWDSSIVGRFVGGARTPGPADGGGSVDEHELVEVQQGVAEVDQGRGLGGGRPLGHRDRAGAAARSRPLRWSGWVAEELEGPGQLVGAGGSGRGPRGRPGRPGRPGRSGRRPRRRPGRRGPGPGRGPGRSSGASGPAGR